MLKIKETKQRKRLRITQCVLYVIQLMLCSMLPYFQVKDTTSGMWDYETVFGMLGLLFADTSNPAYSAPLVSLKTSVLPFYLLFVVIPVVGFFFCALDRERNLKNIVSIICCLGGVAGILFVVTPAYISLGAIIAVLLYIITSFLTTVAMLTRLSNDAEVVTE